MTNKIYHFLRGFHGHSTSSLSNMASRRHLQSGAPPTLIQAPSSSSTPNCLTWLWLCDHGHIKEVSKGVQLFNRYSLEAKNGMCMHAHYNDQFV
jgi:hypothetical protein